MVSISRCGLFSRMFEVGIAVERTPKSANERSIWKVMTRRTLALWLLLSGTRASPDLPTTWSSAISLIIDGVNLLCEFGTCEGNAMLAQDDEKEMTVTRFEMQNRFAPLAYKGTAKEWFNVSEYDTSQGTFVTLQDLCYPNSDMADLARRRRLTSDGGFGARLHEGLAKLQVVRGPRSQFEDMFSWVADAADGGTEACEVDGYAVDCSLWILDSPPYVLTLTVYDNTRPVEYHVLGTVNGVALNVSYFFHTFTTGADPEAFEGLHRADCFAPKQCESNGPNILRDQEFYIFHPANQYDLAGQDIGDALGDAFFVCETLNTGAGDDGYEWISKYKVNLDLTVISQYQNCNGYPSRCMGISTYYVGREAALGLGAPLAGQCDDNELTGNWFSFGVDGECKDGLVLGVNCTWEATRIKTVNGDCLIKDNDYLATCALDGQAPFYLAQKALEDAFLSIEDGGCPPIQQIAGAGLVVDVESS